MGEADEDIVALALDLRRLRPDSVPVNFLMPFEGTPLAGVWELTPQRCLRILALMRFVFPDSEVRVAAGRELHLRSLQPLALHIANSIFLGDYLTSEGQPGGADLEMIEDSAASSSKGATRARPSFGGLVTLRRRGPGTDRAAERLTAEPFSIERAGSHATVGAPGDRVRVAVSSARRRTRRVVSSYQLAVMFFVPNTHRTRGGAVKPRSPRAFTMHAAMPSSIDEWAAPVRDLNWVSAVIGAQ